MEEQRYALYKGETYIMQGTVEEIAEARGILVSTVKFMRSKSYRDRIKAHRKEKGGSLVLMKLDGSELEDVKKKCYGCGAEFVPGPGTKGNYCKMCTRINWQEKEQKKKAKQTRTKESKQKKADAFEAKVRAASAAGISYGKYIALHERGIRL